MEGVTQMGDRDLADGPTDCGLLRRPRVDRLRDLVRSSTPGMGHFRDRRTNHVLDRRIIVGTSQT
jgi:hypothetical protein